MSVREQLNIKFSKFQNIKIMSEKKFSELKVGIFVFIAIAIIISVLFWAKGCMIGKDLTDYKAYFNNVSGLNVGDPVNVNGVRKGKVKEIMLEGDSVAILFSLDKNIKLKKDYKIEVVMTELMGGKQLFVSPGKSPEEADLEKPLYGSTVGDVGAIMKNATAISDLLKELISKFGNTNDNINKSLANLNDIIGDKNMQKNLKSTLSNFEVTSRNLNLLVKENRVSLRNLTDKAGNTLDNVSGLINDNSPEFKKTFSQIQTLTAKVDSLVSSINVITSDIQLRKSGLGKFIYDDEFFKNMNNTLLEIEKLSQKIRQEGIKINLF
jgi:phospholipid/cholesterol/gamma-HCH transport system substrate-binding protein